MVEEVVRVEALVEERGREMGAGLRKWESLVVCNGMKVKEFGEIIERIE